MPGWSPSFTRPSERRERGKSTYDKETPHFLSYVHRSSVICGLIPDDVIAVSEANGKAVPVSLDLRSSLSIQPLEGSRRSHESWPLGLKKCFGYRPESGFAHRSARVSSSVSRFTQRPTACRNGGSTTTPTKTSSAAYPCAAEPP